MSRTKKVLVLAATILCIAIMIFTFLFSKPFYKESEHNITVEKEIQIIKLQLDTNRGEANLHNGSFENPVRIKTIAQGFGFPKYKYQSKIANKMVRDTLVVNYILNIKGLFNELDIQTSIYIDTTEVILLHASTDMGTLVLNNKNSAEVFKRDIE